MSDDSVEWRSRSDIPQPQIDPEFLRRVIESLADLPPEQIDNTCPHCDGYGGYGDGYVPEQKGMLPSMCGYCDGSGKSDT